ncbi:MAG TPA: DUF3854 domain-containing protein [Mesotoga infera]|jgi:hypothetical protein|nr:DUF3854 domain-containing protein [Mesotoga infera]HPI17873.1 DUF3854 domain-containing protein [Mesotoga sp.]HRV02687.1 DUF3854 domain-containing protein [Mesotoga sp.]
MLELRRLPEVKPESGKFRVSIQCPECGDTGGHCGIFLDGGNYYCLKCRAKGEVPGAPRSSYTRRREKSIDNTTAQLLDTTWKKLIRNARPDREETLRYLVEDRGVPQELAESMCGRGYAFVERKGSEIVCTRSEQLVLRKHPALTAANKGKIKVDNLQNGLLIPLYNLSERGDLLLVDYHKRNLYGGSKYIWLASKSKGTDTYGRPSHTFVPGKDGSKLIIVEGEIKAEVAAFYYGYDAIGLIGASSFTKVGEILEHLFTSGKFYEVVYIAPDIDTYQKNTHIAENIVKAAMDVENLNTDVTFLAWLPYGAREKGIDDFLLTSTAMPPAMPLEMSFVEFIDACSTKHSIQKKYGEDPAFIALSDTTRKLTRAMEEEFCDQMVANHIEYTLTTTDIEEVETLSQELFAGAGTDVDAWGQFVFRGGRSVLVDCSPTGSGKSMKIAEHPEALKGPAKRVVYISQSPLNPSVEGLRRFKVQVGRTPYGYIYDAEIGRHRERTREEAEKDTPTATIEANCKNEFIRLLESQGHYAYVSKYCSDCCGHRNECPFRRDRDLLASAELLSVSFSSYVPLDGDLVVVDEFNNLPRYQTDTVDLDEIAEIVARFDARDPEIIEILGRISRLTSTKTEKIRLKDGRTIYKEYSAENLDAEIDPEKVVRDWTEKMQAAKEYIDILTPPLKGNLKHFTPEELRNKLRAGSDRLRSIGQLGDFEPSKIVFSSRWRSSGEEELLRRIGLVESVRRMIHCLNSINYQRGCNVYIAGGQLHIMRKDSRLSNLISRLQDRKVKLLVLDASANREVYTKLFGDVKVHFVKFGREARDESADEDSYNRCDTVKIE